MKTYVTDQWSIVGVPDDEGIANTGGRKGAKEGPAAFRQQFNKLKGREKIPSHIADKGDIKLEGSIEDRHQRTVQLLQEQHLQGKGTILIGGGHDYGYPHLAAVKKYLTEEETSEVGCINIDAHFDVRAPEPEIKSGSPFYMVLEDNIVAPKNLVPFGIQRQSNAASLWEYVNEKGVDYVTFDDIRLGKAIDRFEEKLVHLATHCDAIVISLDLDGIAAAFSPGVSAPHAEGFSASEVIEMMRLAGQQQKVISLGIYELSPPFDVDNRTARLAATSAYHFLTHAIQR